jgi:prepilin-type N-terminal cleavage/methylation domain-containing protein
LSLQRNHREAGFTLIEIMVVIAIIAIIGDLDCAQYHGALE